MSPSKIINVHTHLRKGQDVKERVALWEKCNCVKVCVHVVGRKPGDIRYGNDDLKKCLKEYKDIMLGFALPDLWQKISTPDEIAKFREEGFYGLKFINPSYAYDDDIYFPIYEQAELLDMPVLFHTGFSAIDLNWGDYRHDKVSSEKMRAIRIDTIARAFPKLRIMMAHLGGWPEFGLGLDIISSFENVYGEYSGDSGSKRRETLLRKLFMPLPDANMKDPEENLALQFYRKLCFATDNPDPPSWIDLNMRLLEEFEIPQGLQEDFYWKNASRWLRLK